MIHFLRVAAEGDVRVRRQGLGGDHAQAIARRAVRAQCQGAAGAAL
jgi:hypothetical protein